MPRPVRREILWGTMAWHGRRRSYVFRVDPDGLLAIRLGNPLSWTAFFAIVVGSFLVLNRSLGLGSILLGGALGFAVLGILDRAIARALATQLKERILKSNMNVFLPMADWKGARLEETAVRTYVSLGLTGEGARIAIRRPVPPRARLALDGFLRGRG
jgi:hypothetical protein